MHGWRRLLLAVFALFICALGELWAQTSADHRAVAGSSVANAEVANSKVLQASSADKLEQAAAANQAAEATETKVSTKSANVKEALATVESSSVTESEAGDSETAGTDTDDPEVAAAELEDELASKADAMHAKVFSASDFPTADQCQSCHPRQYRQWSVSQHAYAQLSPVFMAMHNTTNKEQSSTAGDFCIRCHTPIGMTLNESIFASNKTRPQISQEGVTCVACHRQNTDYGKVSGRVAFVPGPLTDPIYGPKGPEILQLVLANTNEFKVVTDPAEKGRKIHREVEPFFALKGSRFCGSCHDVTLVNGFRLEEAYSEFQHSPARAQGQTCQDCHMGKEPGIARGYDFGPAAIVGETETKKRRLSNHYFAGPDYPIIHPGIFPFNPEAKELATMEQWQKFNIRAGWGTDKFEDEVSDDAKFPEPWDDPDARYDARDIIDEQLELLDWAKQQRQTVLEHGYRIASLQLDNSTAHGMDINIAVENPSSGHRVPTGFIAERLVFLEVSVKDADGVEVYASGDRDPNGDVRDLHSSYVHSGSVELDQDLLSLQSKFIIRNIRGGEREAVIPINRSIDPRPFVRPAPFASILTGSPANARIHRKGIPPLKQRLAKYHVDSKKLAGHPEPFTIDVRLIAQMVPVNLITRIQDVGFDFDLAPSTVAKRVVAGSHVLSQRRAVVYLRPTRK